MKQLSLEEKQTVQTQLQAYVSKYPSQNKAVNSLGLSTGTVSAILNGKFDNISDEMFLRIRSLVSPINPEEWAVCETTAYRELSVLLSDMRRGDFIREMARVIGLKLAQTSLREKLQAVTDALRVLDRPLLVFDEGDKLMDTVFYYFISIYNALEGRCGIIFLSTEYIKRRMSIGLEYDKKGYDEIYSRIGRRFIDLTPATRHEVTAVCRANGLIADSAIAEVVADARTMVSTSVNPWDKKQPKEYFDMRRVRKSVHKNKKLAQIKK